VHENGRPVPCRIHLYDSAGQTPKIPGWPSWNDHIVCDVAASLEIPAGKYRFEIERGPEYTTVSGELAVTPGELVKLQADIVHFADLKTEGWWSGELHVHRPIEDVELMMRGEDMYVTQVTTWLNNLSHWTYR